MSVTHAEARAIVNRHGESAIRKMCERGRNDPASLTPDEVRAVAAYAWLQQMKKQV